MASKKEDDESEIVERIGEGKDSDEYRPVLKGGAVSFEEFMPYLMHIKGLCDLISAYTVRYELPRVLRDKYSFGVYTIQSVPLVAQTYRVSIHYPPTSRASVDRRFDDKYSEPLVGFQSIQYHRLWCVHWQGALDMYCAMLLEVDTEERHFLLMTGDLIRMITLPKEETILRFYHRVFESRDTLAIAVRNDKEEITFDYIYSWMHKHRYEYEHSVILHQLSEEEK